MLKLPLIAVLAGTSLGAMALGAGPALAQVCLNPYASAVSPSHDDMVPNEGFGYDKNFVDQQLAKGNRCPPGTPTTQQSYRPAATGYGYPTQQAYPYGQLSPSEQYNRRPNPNASKSRGTYY